MKVSVSLIMLFVMLLFAGQANAQVNATVAATNERTVVDALWIWGHPAGVYNDTHLRSTGRISTIEPIEAAQQMGLHNMMFVRFGTSSGAIPEPPFDEYYTPLKKMNRVYFSMVAAGGGTSSVDREAAFSLAKKNENIVGWILDDFFHEPAGGNAEEWSQAMLDDPKAPMLRASLTPEELRVLRQRKVRGQQLPVMAVVYTGHLKPGARAHLAEVDQLSLWTWRPADLKYLESNLAALEKLAPGKPIFLGCYMYDFNESKPLPVDLMRQQVELGYQCLKQGRIQGMIFLATANVDVGLEAVEWTRQWIRETGNQTYSVRGK